MFPRSIYTWGTLARCIVENGVIPRQKVVFSKNEKEPRENDTKSRVCWNRSSAKLGWESGLLFNCLNATVIQQKIKYHVNFEQELKTWIFINH